MRSSIRIPRTSRYYARIAGATPISITMIKRVEKHVVTGRIAAPPDITPARLLDLIDKGNRRSA
jgi:hypothetical protein